METLYFIYSQENYFNNIEIDMKSMEVMEIFKPYEPTLLEGPLNTLDNNCIILNLI